MPSAEDRAVRDGDHMSVTARSHLWRSAVDVYVTMVGPARKGEGISTMVVPKDAPASPSRARKQDGLEHADAPGILTDCRGRRKPASEEAGCPHAMQASRGR